MTLLVHVQWLDAPEATKVLLGDDKKLPTNFSVEVRVGNSLKAAKEQESSAVLMRMGRELKEVYKFFLLSSEYSAGFA